MNNVQISALKSIRLDLVTNRARGYQHIHLNQPGTSFIGVVVRTEPNDDAGCAHAVEHLVGRGSIQYPETDSFARLLCSPGCVSMNNYTRPGATQFCLEAATFADLLKLSHRYLDGIFRPLLRAADFLSEIHDPSIGGQPGVMLNEMRQKYSDPRYLAQRRILRSIFPDSPLGFDFSGAPDCIVNLSNQTIRSFHNAHYRPDNVLLFSCGPFDPTAIATILDDVMAEQGWRETKSIHNHQCFSENVDSSSYALKDALLVWRCPAVSDLQSAFLAGVLAHGLWQNPGAAFRRWLVRCSSSRRLSSATGVMLDFPSPIICIGVADLNMNFVEFENAALSVLSQRNSLCRPDLLIRRVALDISMRFDGPKRRRAEVFRRLTHAFTNRLDLLGASSPSQDAEIIAQLQEKPSLVEQTLQAWLVRSRCLIRVGAEDQQPVSAGTIPPFRAAECAEILVREEAAGQNGSELPVTFRPSTSAIAKLHIYFNLAHISPHDAALIQVLVHNVPNLKNKAFSNMSLASWTHLLTLGISETFSCDPDLYGLSAGWEMELSQDSLPDVLHLFQMIISGFQVDGDNASACLTRTLNRASNRLRREPLPMLMRCCRAQVSDSGRIEFELMGLPFLFRLARMAQEGRAHPEHLAEQLNAVAKMAFISSNLRLQVTGSDSVSTEVRRAISGLVLACPAIPAKDATHVPTHRLPLLTDWIGIPGEGPTGSLYVCHELICLPSDPQHLVSLVASIQQELFKRCREARGVYAVQVLSATCPDRLEIWTMGDPSPARSLVDIEEVLTIFLDEQGLTRMEGAQNANVKASVPQLAVAAYGPLNLLDEIKQANRRLCLHWLPD